MTSSPEPTVDLGYPTEPHGRVPSFNNIEEEAEFWDTHDFTDLAVSEQGERAHRVMLASLEFFQLCPVR